jgi:signal peptidase I
MHSVAINVYPPRAGTLARHVRRWLPWRRFYYPLRDVVIQRGGALERGAASVFDTASLKPGSLPRMVVPGWAQRFQGQTQRGKAFFGVWSAFLTTGLMCFGSTLGSVMFGLTFAVHAGSILDLLMPRTDRTLRQIALRGAAVAIALLALYIPVSRAVLHFVDARQWMQDTGPFASGDVILYNPRAYLVATPQPGDIVLFQDSRWSMRGPGNGHTIYQGGGEWMDRILAGPGDTVTWKGGELWVNGRRSDLRPLGPLAIPDQDELLVPPNTYYIVPSTNPMLAQVIAAVQRYDVFLHSARSFLGKAIVRHYPIWRWWWMQ